MGDRTRTRKGTRTRARILQSAAALFNRQGYAATPISDVLTAAGIEKGGLYRHFASKDALAAAAFDFAAQTTAAHHRAIWERATTSREKLSAVICGFAELEAAPPMAGGCPLFNAAIEADDRGGGLRTHVARALQNLHASVAQIVRGGIANHEFDAVDADGVASVLVAALEGALVLARLERDACHLRRVGAHLESYVASFTRPRGRRSPSH